MSPQRIALAVFFASVVINAGLGIVALFVGDFGETQGKVLMTSLSISAASVLSLAMFPARERGLLGPIPVTGMALSALGFALVIVLAWTEYSEDNLGKTAGSILVFAVSAGYACLIALAVVHPRFINVVRAAYALVAVLSVLVVVAIWGEPEDDFMPRVMGIISILLAAATVSIPVLHRISRRAMTGMSTFTTGGLPTRCVSCGATAITSDDGITFTCDECQAKFRAEILA